LCHFSLCHCGGNEGEVVTVLICLQADQLFDVMTQEFHCTFCREIVEEDQSALPKKDSRLLLAKFNEQLEPLYILLREVEGIKLAPEILEPEPVDLSTIRGCVPYASSL
jgi:transcription initiation factor TFIIE subunit alpha